MNPKIIFKLHEPQHNVNARDQKATYVYLFFSYGYYIKPQCNNSKKKYIPLKYSTGLQIKPYCWNDRPLYRAKKNSFESSAIFNKKLDFLQDLILKVYHEYEDHGLIPTPAQLKERFENKVNTEVRKPVLKLNDYISTYIKDAIKGKRLSSQQRKYSKVSIKNLIGFQVQFNSYQRSISESLNYDNINAIFLRDFIQFFREKNYSQNTISRHIKHLRMFMRTSRKEGLHTNYEIDHQRFKVRQMEVEQIFLNEIELNKLFKIDLTLKPKLEIVRDVFLIGCYIAQRYSDYRSITKDQLIQLDDEKKAIEILQSKTDRRIILPLRNEAIELLKKYDYTLPYTYEQQINTKIREIGKMAGLDELVEVKVISGGRMRTKSIPRYKFIKTHTARRSGCTNMYLANVPINEIMTISGHQTVYDFMKYIRASEIQIAKKLAVHPYFADV